MATGISPVPTRKTPQTGIRANCSVVLSVCARPQRDVQTGIPGMSQHTAQELFMYADTHMHAQITSHIAYLHIQHAPTSTPAQGYRALLMLGRQELMEERLGRKLKAKKKVESPAHDSSPITSVNPGAQE